ncbi:MAG: DUF2185 domain-containing protein [Pseudomonadota bacterium]
MFKERKFKLTAAEIVPLLGRPMGSGFASDHITVKGLLVGFMCRDEAGNEVDSGWCFLSGTESQVYADDSDNWAIYDLNTIANYDQAIIPYLDFPVGTELERIPGTNQFRRIK